MDKPETYERKLFQSVDGLGNIVQPLSFLNRPTPITEEAPLADKWGLASFHVKRDDQTSTVYGGSKARMLEYFFGRAKSAGRNSVASMGPYISHQLLGIGTFANVLGMECKGVLAPQPYQDEIEDYKRYYEDVGVKTRRCKTYFHIPGAYLKTRFGGPKAQRPFWVPPGGNDPYGVLALVDAAFEFAQQLQEGVIPMPDDVVVPTGTCATAAGLYLGFSMLKLPIRLVAVRVVPMTWTSSYKLRKTARKGLKVLRKAGFSEEVEWGDLLWVNDHAAPGYGMSNDMADEAMNDVRKEQSFRTEVTYTGKTLAIFKTDALKGRKVVFWNTFSAVEPNLNAWK